MTTCNTLLSVTTRNTQDKDIIRLVIGYHQLEGKRISLKKPFAILEKARMLRWPLPAGGF